MSEPAELIEVSFGPLLVILPDKKYTKGKYA